MIVLVGRCQKQSNKRKHGVSFESTWLVFDGLLHITRQDRVEGGELRWQTAGMAGGVVLLFVAHAWRHEVESGEEHTRIISARRAAKEEKRIYEQST